MHARNDDEDHNPHEATRIWMSLHDVQIQNITISVQIHGCLNKV